MKTHSTYVLLLTIIGGVAVSCNLYPDDDARTSDLDIIATYYDTAFNFPAAQTYALDSVRWLTADTSEIPDEELDPKLVSILENTIDLNMQSRNYSKVAIDSTPSLIITVGVLRSDYLIWSGGWWGWCDPYWCYPGWGWGYPGYGGLYPGIPVGGVVGSYSTGTVWVDMYDPSNVNDTTNQISIVWTGVAYGLAGSNSDYLRVQNGVNTMFNQSPYIKSSN